MSDKSVDILVVGGGAAGLATALGFARAGFTVELAGAPQSLRDDGRSAAIFSSSFEFLDEIGVGDALRETGWPLRAIRIVDISGAIVRAPTTTFRAAEIGQPEFGWNIANSHIVRILLEAARKTPGLTLSTSLFRAFEPVEAGSLTAIMDDTSRRSAQLVIAADGQKSPVREAAGIPTRVKPYPQVALTYRVKHTKDHDDISTEFHTREGPLTFVPAGELTSAIVWIMRPGRANQLHAMGREEIVSEIERLSGRVLGRLEMDEVEGRVPLQKLVASRITASRIALVGEAAHAFPPIGAQGLNLGFRDVSALVRLIARQGRADPGDPATLKRFERERKFDVEARSAGVDLLNSALIADQLPLDLARAGGLALFQTISPLRRIAMRVGGGLPFFPQR
jgi:2-octaprenyl-6-methoxyphenol hydroxylase